MINKVEICGVDTSKLTVLNEKQKRELMIKIKNGDTHARDMFISGNLKLVLSIVQRFSYSGELADDIFQVGCVGLIKAIDNFDVRHNVQFSTYAVPMIIGEIRRYLRDNNMLRVSRSLKDIAYKTLSLKEKLTNEQGREPTIEELSKKLDIPAEDINLALAAILDPISLFEPVYHDDGDAIYVMDHVRDIKNNEENWVKSISINDAIKELSEREQTILRLRFYEDKTQMEVAEEIGISQAQVSRLEKSAMVKIKKNV